jgi:hypothetical protein
MLLVNHCYGCQLLVDFQRGEMQFIDILIQLFFQQGGQNSRYLLAGDIRQFNLPDADPFAGNVESNRIGLQPLLETFVSNVRPDTVFHIGCTALPADGVGVAKREKNLKDGTHSLSPV